MKVIIFSTLLAFAFVFCDCKHLKCVPVICPPCNLLPNETVAETQMKILSARGPADGTCLEGAIAFYRGADYGLDNDACCCMDVPAYPPLQCDPIGPGISVCPPAPTFFKDETIGDYYLQIGLQMKNFAPADGCCPDGTAKFIASPSITSHPQPICVCFDPNVHPTEKDSSSSSCSSSSERRRNKNWM